MKKFNLVPIAGGANRVFIKRAESPKEEVTEGGLIIPTTFQRNSGDGNMELVEKILNEGTVIAVSPQDPQGNKPTVKAGDYVFFGEFSGAQHRFEGEDYLVMKEAEVHAKLVK